AIIRKSGKKLYGVNRNIVRSVHWHNLPATGILNLLLEIHKYHGFLLIQLFLPIAKQLAVVFCYSFSFRK
ncbi:MAG: hypothetical protein Q8N60_01645, partial [Candidatus Diapherotrites archaeon]|nr:hypothetical protein [Candidatus Diapherotrites archaeon]